MKRRIWCVCRRSSPRMPCLLEPLSVVEKCAERIEAVRQTDGRNALVLGLGPVGDPRRLSSDSGVIGLRCTRRSRDHPRVSILRAGGVEYTRSLDGRWDVIVEAAGSAEKLALAAVRLLGSCGVFVTLGAQRTTGEFSFIDLIVGNQSLVGIVNASRGAFEQGVVDLGGLPEPALRRMIRRFGFGDYRSTFTQPSTTEPKFVHVIANSLH